MRYSGLQSPSGRVGEMEEEDEDDEGGLTEAGRVKGEEVDRRLRRRERVVAVAAIFD